MKRAYDTSCTDDSKYDSSAIQEKKVKLRKNQAQYGKNQKENLKNDTNKKEAQQKKQREKQARYRERLKVNSKHNDSKLAKQRLKERERKAKQREKKKRDKLSNDTAIPNVPNIASTVDTDTSLKKAVVALNRTSLNRKNCGIQEELHAALVCIICDQFIIGMEPHFWISTKTILKHKHRLSAQCFENFSQTSLHPDLVSQYQVEDPQLQGILLSPRAQKQNDSYMCCITCKNALISSRVNSKPPRFAIANGWMIGYIPKSVVSSISEILSSMIAPIRPFAYVFSYSGGAHKTMKGNYTFFKSNINHVGGVLQNYLSIGANPNVYVVLCGKFTPKQRKILQEKVCVDLQDFNTLLKWMIDHGHPSFSNVQPLNECPRPILIQER